MKYIFLIDYLVEYIYFLQLESINETTDLFNLFTNLS